MGFDEEFFLIREDLFAVADRFKPRGQVVDVREYGSGNVNDTFLVTLDSVAGKRFVLQRINTQVFRRPELIMLNLRIITEHVRKRLPHSLLSNGRRWETPYVLFTRTAQDHWVDDKGSFWRAVSFIDGVESFDIIKDLDHAGEVGYALGVFHSLICDLPVEKLADTLEGFHITPLYLRHYDEILARHSPVNSPEAVHALRFVSRRSAWAHVLEEAKCRGILPIRPIHGDPKVNNVLMDIATHQAVSIVDLDTVKPGLIHYDIGDCLRSSCNPLGEETVRWESVRFEPDLCRAILQDYLWSTKDSLTPNEFEYMFDAVRLIAFELGLRFFTDYLEGNVYFKARHREHNLIRALVQFKLTESIESQETSIRAIIRSMR
jgi:Ser/Thr protein kinase RdoA (MazF antagonist)